MSCCLIFQKSWFLMFFQSRFLPEHAVRKTNGILSWLPWSASAKTSPEVVASSSQSLNSQITLAIIFRRGSSTSSRQSQATPRQNGSSRNTWNSAGVFLIMAGPDNIADFYKMPDFAQKVKALTVCLSLWRASNFRSSLSRKQISLFALACKRGQEEVNWEEGFILTKFKQIGLFAKLIKLMQRI